MINQIKDHISFTSCGEIQKICQEFFNYSGITYFNFVRAYDDNKRICLYNRADWMHFVFTNHHKYDFAFEETPNHLCTNYLIWDLMEEVGKDPLIAIAREQYNIDHGFTHITRYDGYTEFCYFATTQDKEHLNHFYVNNKKLLMGFILYFKDKAQKIIQKAEEEYLILDGHSLFWLEKNSLLPDVDKSFFDICNVEKFYLNGKQKNTHLTIREAESLTYLFEGKSNKEIAKKLEISPRTVESYIDNIKLKLNCTHKSQLIEMAKQSGFLTIYNYIKARDVI